MHRYEQTNKQQADGDIHIPSLNTHIESPRQKQLLTLVPVDAIATRSVVPSLKSMRWAQDLQVESQDGDRGIGDSFVFTANGSKT
jgi:hypothetical protein